MTVIPKHLELIVASSLFSLSNAWWKNTSKESEDHEKNPQWEKHAEGFLKGASLQTVPDFFSWLKSNYSPAEKHQGCEYLGSMLLHSAPWCSSLALGLIWRCHVRYWGWGSCRRQNHWVKGAPHRGEGTLILNCWSWWLGLAITRWQVHIHFSVKHVSLVWWRLFLLNYMSHSATDEESAISDQKVEPTAKQLWLPWQRNSVSTDARTIAVKSYLTRILCKAIRIKHSRYCF